MSTKPVRVAIVAAVFNRGLVDVMVQAAEREIKEEKAKLVLTALVSGSYEIPLIANALLARDDVDALVVLGFIERGETLHGEVMGSVVHGALVQLQLAHDKPVGIGMIGPGATIAQAESRKVRYARAAVRAALVSLSVRRDLV